MNDILAGIGTSPLEPNNEWNSFKVSIATDRIARLMGIGLEAVHAELNQAKALREKVKMMQKEIENGMGFRKVIGNSLMSENGVDQVLLNIKAEIKRLKKEEDLQC